MQPSLHRFLFLPILLIMLGQALRPTPSYGSLRRWLPSGVASRGVLPAQSARSIQAPPHRHFYRPGIDPRPFQFPLPAGQKLKHWLSAHREEFLAHGIWQDNVKPVMQSGRILPAEVVLRNTGSISFEATKHYGNRQHYHLRTREIEALFQEVGPIQACDGVVFLKLDRAEGTENTYSVLLRKSETPEWTLIKTIAFDASLNELRASPMTLNDHRMIRGLTDPSGNPIDVELPVLNCSIHPQHSDLLLRIRGRRLRSHTAGVHPEIYLNFAGELEKRQQLIDYAVAQSLPREALLIAHDQYFGGTADREILQALPLFQTAVLTFVDRYLHLSRQTQKNTLVADIFLQSLGIWTPVDPQEDRIKTLLYGIRGAIFGGESLQPDISLSVNGLAPYGKVFALIGHLEKPSIGLPPILNAYHYPTLDSAGLMSPLFRLGEIPLFECRSAPPLGQGGRFGEIDLRDPDVLIIGPKTQLASIPETSHYNVIYSDDLSAEEKRLIPAFGLDYEIRDEVRPGTHPLD